MLKRVDESRFLSNLLPRLSNLLARRRGLPVVVGIVLVVIGFVLQVINVPVESRLIELLGIIAHNAGVLIALVGLTLAIPLGR